MQATEKSLAQLQYDAALEARLAAMPPADAAAEAARLGHNATLERYYSQRNGLCVSVGGEVTATLPCERVAFEYPCQDPNDPSQWQAAPRGQLNAARAPDGKIWAFINFDWACVDGGHEQKAANLSTASYPLFCSADAGHSWTWTRGASGLGVNVWAFTIRADGTFLIATDHCRTDTAAVYASQDDGSTWALRGRLPLDPPHVCMEEDISSMTQLSDGTILLTGSHHAAGPGGQRIHSVFRSADGGCTWSATHTEWDEAEFPCRRIDGTVMCTESHILELQSGKLLHAIRWNCDAQTAARMPDQWRQFKKTVCFLESYDQGRTWQNPRPVVDDCGEPVLEPGECHGQLVQVPDGRVVLVHDRRYPHGEAQTVAHVSRDDGRTWQRQVYHLCFGDSYPASVVLEDGTIVTVAGAGLRENRFDANGQAVPIGPRELWTSAAVRWRLPE